jgi:hypothetical protein
MSTQSQGNSFYCLYVVFRLGKILLLDRYFHPSPVLAFVEKLQSNEKKKLKLLLQKIPKFIIKIFFQLEKKKCKGVVIPFLIEM